MQIKSEAVVNRIIEASELDQRHLLRPLLLFMGSQSEGRIRSLWNLLTTMMDMQVPSVTEAIKIARTEDYRHICGLHANPVNSNFCSIISRVSARKDVAANVPGLWEYARHLGHSSGGNIYLLEPIETYALRVRSSRDWRLMPGHLRPKRYRREEFPELYPYISGSPTSEHDMLMAVDAIVPKGLPNSVRCDVCQDMIVAVLSGEVTVENLRGDLKKYMGQFWKMFPDKYGHISLDAVVRGTDDFKLIDTISNKGRRL
jgi:hypothetical protein